MMRRMAGWVTLAATAVVAAHGLGFRAGFRQGKRRGKADTQRAVLAHCAELKAQQDRDEGPMFASTHGFPRVINMADTVFAYKARCGGEG